MVGCFAVGYALDLKEAEELMDRDGFAADTAMEKIFNSTVMAMVVQYL